MLSALDTQRVGIEVPSVLQKKRTYGHTDAGSPVDLVGLQKAQKCYSLSLTVISELSAYVVASWFSEVA